MTMKSSHSTPPLQSGFLQPLRSSGDQGTPLGVLRTALTPALFGLRLKPTQRRFQMFLTVLTVAMITGLHSAQADTAKLVPSFLLDTAEPNNPLYEVWKDELSIQSAQRAKNQKRTPNVPVRKSTMQYQAIFKSGDVTTLFSVLNTNKTCRIDGPVNSTIQTCEARMITLKNNHIVKVDKIEDLEINVESSDDTTVIASSTKNFTMVNFDPQSHSISVSYVVDGKSSTAQILTVK